MTGRQSRTSSSGRLDDCRPGGPLVSVSIIIPARNEEAYIANSLTSVLAQLYPGQMIECIVVNNDSWDETETVVMRVADDHPGRRIVVVEEPQPGVGRAKNSGARAATGEILVFLDADSWMDDTLVSDVVGRYRSGCPAGSIRIVADSADRLERGFFALLEVGKVLFGVRAQMMYCERALFLELGGFRPDLRQAEDLDFLRRARRHVRRTGRGAVCHIRSSAIATSPRRLRGGPLRRNLIVTFVRWVLASAGIGRTWEY